jgi:hypothetical protein
MLLRRHLGFLNILDHFLHLRFSLSLKVVLSFVVRSDIQLLLLLHAATVSHVMGKRKDSLQRTQHAVEPAQQQDGQWHILRHFYLHQDKL